MRNALLVAIFLTARLSFGQTAPAQEFDVASVKPNTSGANANGGSSPGGRLTLTNVTLNDLIRIAYNVKDTEIIGGADWTRNDHFDVAAKGPPGASEDAVIPMLQALLAKDFSLAVHREDRPEDVFALTVAKGGPKLEKAEGLTTGDCVRKFVDGNPHAECTDMTISRFGEQHLRFLAPGYIDRPVVDLTGITGYYNFKLDWVGNAKLAEGGLTMFDAVTKQLGLKLEQRKLPTSVVVIDRAEHLQAE